MRRPTTRIVLGLLLLIAAAFLFHREAREEKPKRTPPTAVVETTPPPTEPVAAAPAPTPPPAPPRPRSPSPKPIVEPTVPPVDRAGLGILRGAVRILGKPPVRRPVRMDAVPDCAAAHDGVVLSDDLVVDPKGGVRWAFVYVKSGVKGSPPPAPSAPVLLDQVGCMFSPHVLGIRVGQPLLLRNSDPTLHNVHAVTFANMEFNIGIPAHGESTQRLRKREIMLQARCNLHPWMSAWIGVLDHPHFAATGEEGSYAIPNLPAGRYVLEVWHEKYASVTREVDVFPGEDSRLDFILDARKS